MYIPNAFWEDEAEKLISFMQAHRFATLIDVCNGVPTASD
jgi:predicted FMN-binding regulatory protein PaiB